jgi:hypothetical protein
MDREYEYNRNEMMINGIGVLWNRTSISGRWLRMDEDKRESWGWKILIRGIEGWNRERILNERSQKP